MWLGYPGSSGASYMDYIITDKFTSPLHLAEQYSEKLAYMPHTFFVGDHRYMFPHLLLKGQGTLDPEPIKSIDSQAGVIQVNNVIQKPSHPVINTMSAQMVAHSQGHMQHSMLNIQQQTLLASLQQQQNILLQQQHSIGGQSSMFGNQVVMGMGGAPQLVKQEQAPLGSPTNLPLTTRAHYGLPENAVVYCNFNQLYKIDPATLESWVNILKRVPNSFLWLLKFPASGEANVSAMATKLGIQQGRIVFSHVASKEEHVRRGRLADLCLDTPLCNGHTTGMDVLWAGTPVLTLPLESLASRVAGSQLHALGFPELVASTRQEYEEKAIRLGNNASE